MLNVEKTIHIDVMYTMSKKSLINVCKNKTNVASTKA